MVGRLKRLFANFSDFDLGPVLHATEFDYKEVLTLKREDISYDLNGEVPKLYIKGQEVGVVVMTNQYVTRHERGEGFNTITFIYLTEGDPKQRVLSIDRITGEVMNQ